ncbi:MAG: ATP-binding protein [Mariprofundaceae bacterium]|nr:ATP-binding protein [Mariprofundaceae bacterium]
MSLASILQPHHDKRVRQKQIRLHLEQTSHGVMAGIPGVFLLAWVIYPFNTLAVLLTWLACMILFLSYRLWWNQQQLHNLDTSGNPQHIFKTLLVHTTLSGFAWALVVLMMPDQFEAQLIVLGMACILAIGSTISLSSYLLSFITAVLPAMAAICLWFITQDQFLLIIAGISAAILTLFLTMMTAKLQQQTLENMALSFENHDLVADLRSFKDALEHAAEPITIFTATGKLKYNNPAFTYMTGFTTDELKGLYWQHIYSNFESAKGLFSQDKQTLSGLPWSGSLKVKTTAEDLDVMCGFSPVRDVSGNIKELVNIQRDVRKENMLQQKLEKLNRMEALSLMASSIAHDFNNILTAILGNAQLAEMQSKESPKVLKSTQRIVRSVAKATALCKQMLAYSGKGSFIIGELQLSTILEDMKKVLDKATGQQYQLTFHIDEKVGEIEGDDVQIRQMLMNLAINAGEALQGREDGMIAFDLNQSYLEKSALSHMHTEQQDLHAGEFMCLSITDNGEGIAQENLEKIYEPFFSTRFVGRGLGLSAVHGIIRGHGGGINITSEEGVGTTVCVILPIIPATA